MLAIVFSDIQINSYKQFNKENCRLNNCLKALDEVFSFAAKKQINYILFPGDLYDTQKILGTEVVNRTIEIFLKWQKSNPEIQVIAISGNHDHATKNLVHSPAVTGLTHLDAVCPNFYLIDNSDYFNGEGLVIYGIPYYERKEDYVARLTEVSARAAKGEDNSDRGLTQLLLIHQTPSGTGNESYPVDTDINDPLYNPFEFVYCGHIHKHMLLSEKFMLVGSPIHRSLEDEGIDKGFVVTDLSNPQAGYKFISLNKKLPEFRRVIEGTLIPDEWQKDYITWLPKPISRDSKHQVATDQFKSDLSPATLIENYWNQVDGKDKELLSVGLQLVDNK